MTQTDPFYRQAPNQLGPASHLVAITPSDTTPFPVPYRRIYVGGTGSVTLIARDDRANTSPQVTLAAVPAGTVLDIWTQQVMATGTTATGLVGLY